MTISIVLKPGSRGVVTNDEMEALLRGLLDNVPTLAGLAIIH
jgi:hypothetical protein